MKYLTHHLCIKISDKERSIEFYSKALGFTLETIIHHTTEISSIFMVSEDGNLKLQLLCGMEPDRFCPEYGHLGMKTRDIKVSFDEHSRMGCISQEIVEQPHQFNYFIKDPDGYEIEIVQVKK